MVIIESLTIGPDVVGLSYPRGAVTTYLAFGMMMMMMVIKIVWPCLSVNPVLSWMLLDSLRPNRTSNRFCWGGYVCEVGFQRASGCAYPVGSLMETQECSHRFRY